MASSAHTDDMPTAAPSRLAIPSTSLLAFALVAGQFALILLAVERFELENEAFRNVLRLAFAGFWIHHFLPLRLRQPFFLLLSLASVAWVLGVDANGWSAAAGFGRTAALLGIGAALVGICHLPLPWLGRVSLLGVAGAGLAVLRTGTFVDLGPWSAVWPSSARCSCSGSSSTSTTSRT